MSEPTAVSLKSIPSVANVSVKYATSTTDVDVSTLTQTDTLEVQSVENTRYVYIILSIVDTTIHTTYTQEIVWNYGVLTTVTYNINGEDVPANAISNLTVDELSPPAMEEGDTFLGWYLDADYTKPVTFPFDPQGETLYAKIATNLPSSWIGWDGATYYVKQGTKSHIANITDLVIPETYDDGTNGLHEVTYMAQRTYYSIFDSIKSTLKSVTLPETMTKIGDYAFCDLTNLKSVNLGECTSLTSIGRKAFRDCTSLKSITFEDTNNWYRTTNSNYSGGTKTTVTDSSTNADYLVTTYVGYYWYNN